MYQNNFPFKRYQITVDFIKKYIGKNEFILDLGVENPLSKILRDNGFKIDNTGGEDLDIDIDDYERYIENYLKKEFDYIIEMNGFWDI